MPSMDPHCIDCIHVAYPTKEARTGGTALTVSLAIEFSFWSSSRHSERALPHQGLGRHASSGVPCQSRDGEEERSRPRDDTGLMDGQDTST